MKKVSVIIPAYNKSDLTAKTVQSVLNQTYTNIEILVVDDGSTDNVKQALTPFLNQIKYIYKENGGACSARNLGLKESTGEYVAFIDCDDLYIEGKIEQCVNYLEKNPQFGFVHTAAYFIGEDDHVVGEYSHSKSKNEGDIAHSLIFGNFICNSTALIRKSCLDNTGTYDESIFMPADWDLWLRLAEQNKVGYIDQPLTKYRVTDNYILNKIELCEEEEKIVIDKFFNRNQKLSGHFRNRVLSSFYLRYAQCHFIQNHLGKMKEKFRLSLKMNPLNWKTYTHILYYLLARKSLKNILERKILRYGF